MFRRLFSLAVFLFSFFALQANSAIIYHNTEITLETPFNDQNNEWDIDGDGDADLIVRNEINYLGDLGFSSTSPDFISTSPDHQNISNLLQNFSVISALTDGYEWITPPESDYNIWSFENLELSNFTPEESGYLGFRFDHNENGTKDRYGWAKVVFRSGNTSYQINILEWAYEDSGSSIFVGQIPEPAAASLLLLALGASGLRRLRRKD